MTNAELIATIRAEIERLHAEHSSRYETDEAGLVLEKLEYLLSDLEKSLPKVTNCEGLEEEIEQYLPKIPENPYNEELRVFARYFYDLGCCRTAEKYDEIEYERKRAEEQANEDLEKEINKEIDKIWAIKRDESGKITNGVSEWKETDQLMNIPAIFHFARHFAQWGAERLKK